MGKEKSKGKEEDEEEEVRCWLLSLLMLIALSGFCIMWASCEGILDADLHGLFFRLVSTGLPTPPIKNHLISSGPISSGTISSRISVPLTEITLLHS